MLKKIKSKLIMVRVTFFLLTIATVNVAQNIPTLADVEADHRFIETRQLIMKKMNDQNIPSIVVGVAKGKNVLWLESFGWSNKKMGIKASSNTIYALGSLSKSITSTGIFALIAQNQLTLETNISDLIDDDGLIKKMKDPDKEIQIQHLLNSTAGIPHGWISFNNNNELISDFSLKENKFACFPSGEVFEYSNYSFGELQKIIEFLSKKSYHDALDELIFTPLNMKNSYCYYDTNNAHSFAIPYNKDGSPVSRRHNTPEGGLGLYSTAKDLLNYGMFHVGSLSLKQSPPFSHKWRNIIHEPIGGPGKNFFSHGWWSVDNNVRISNGSIKGANANLTIVPSDKIVVVLLTNKTSSIADELSGEIIKIFLPDFKEKSKYTREKYRSMFRTPYSSNNSWPNELRGKILTNLTEISIKLNFTKNDVIIKIDGESPDTLRNLSLNNFDEFRGSFSGNIDGISPTKKNNHLFKLTIRRKQDSFYGYISAVFQTDFGGFSLPFYVELKPFNK